MSNFYYSPPETEKEINQSFDYVEFLTLCGVTDPQVIQKLKENKCTEFWWFNSISPGEFGEMFRGISKVLAKRTYEICFNLENLVCCAINELEKPENKDMLEKHPKKWTFIFDERVMSKLTTFPCYFRYNADNKGLYT